MPAMPPILRVSSYVIERELGRGAHGVVYRAHHSSRPGVPLALKVIENRGNLDRLMIEPAILSRLDHPNIVGIEDYFLHGDQLVVALEFIEGEDLKSALDRGQVYDQGEVRELLRQIGAALVEAHTKDVIHRDIKPSNILVVRNKETCRFVLTDFGIGQVAEGIQLQKHVGGTYCYMAPEQLRGRPCLQSDLWALGVVAYQMLTGRLPFPGPTLSDLAGQILYSAPMPASEGLTGAIDPELETIVQRLLDKSLQERVSSAAELLQLLGHKTTANVARTSSHKSHRAGRTLDRQLERGIRLRRSWLVVCVLVYLISGGVFMGLLLLSGMVLFYLSQTEGWPSRINALLAGCACLMLAGYSTVRHFFPLLDCTSLILPLLPAFAAFMPDMLGPWVGYPVMALIWAVSWLILFLPAVAGAIYTGGRRLQRDKILRDAALDESTASERYLRAFQVSLDSRFEDVGLHLKYAEALFSRGQIKEAVVEALLLLRQDPYHFNANLLLANGYLALGLLERCLTVCDDYLKVTGCCFELAELRGHCQRRLGKS